MTTSLRNFGVLSAFVLLVASGAHAAPITVSFTATGFVPLVGSNPAPDDPVSGTIVYDASAVNAPIDSLISISLTIGDHTYSLDEIGFVNNGGFAYVGGLIDGVLGSGNFEDDFWIIWDQTTLLPLDFLYATLVDPAGIWDTQTFGQFSVTSSAPEPTTFALLALGLLGMAAALRRRNTVGHYGP